MSTPGYPSERRWLIWAREIQALSQTGLAFTQDQYDHERYQRLQSLAALIMAEHTGIAAPDIEVMFTRQTGYATPKLGVRGAVFQDSKILLVREAEDGHRWTLPGGWADVNESPAEAVSQRSGNPSKPLCRGTSRPRRVDRRSQCDVLARMGCGGRGSRSRRLGLLLVGPSLPSRGRTRLAAVTPSCPADARPHLLRTMGNDRRVR